METKRTRYFLEIRKHTDVRCDGRTEIYYSIPSRVFVNLKAAEGYAARLGYTGVKVV